MQFIYSIIFFLLLFPISSYALQAHVSWKNNWTADIPATQNIIKKGIHGTDLTESYYVLPNISSFIDTNLSEGIAYDWQVFAANNIGTSTGSNITCGIFYNGLIPVFPSISTISGSSINIPAPSASIVGIQWQIDGINYSTENTTPPFSLTIIDSTIFTNGNHLLTAIIRNSDGSITSTQKSITIQNIVSPIVWYPMDEGNGLTINDKSGNGNTATIDNLLNWINPGANSSLFALSFLSNGKITTNFSKHNTIRTYMIWTKRSGPGGGNYGRIFDKRTNGAEVELLYNDEASKVYRFARVWSGGSGSWSIPQPSLNVWHHIAVVYDSSSSLNIPRIYLDGIQQSVSQMTAPSGSPLMNTDPYILGNRGVSDRTWNGALDNFKIYNVDITDIVNNW